MSQKRGQIRDSCIKLNYSSSHTTKENKKHINIVVSKNDKNHCCKRRHKRTLATSIQFGEVGIEKGEKWCLIRIPIKNSPNLFLGIKLIPFICSYQQQNKMTLNLMVSPVCSWFAVVLRHQTETNSNCLSRTILKYRNSVNSKIYRGYKLAKY